MRPLPLLLLLLTAAVVVEVVLQLVPLPLPLLRPPLLLSLSAWRLLLVVQQLMPV
jgi:hypothetical protein